MADRSSPAAKPETRPAATLLLLRERQEAAPEVLMAQRDAKMAFGAGAMVFPGGAVDNADFALAREIAPHLELDDGAARVAAIREMLEECGLAVGFATPVEHEAAKAMRAVLHAGGAMADALALTGASLILDALAPFARWRPPPGSVTRAFDTRFYCAVADESLGEPEADGSETVHLLWSDAAAMLAEVEEGRARALFPTVCNLQRLAQFGTIEQIIDHALATPVELIVPVFEEHEGVRYVSIPSGLGYPFTRRERARAM